MKEKASKRAWTKWLFALTAFLFLILLWYVLYHIVGNSMRVPSPAVTASALLTLVSESTFYSATGYFFLRVLGGWLIGCTIGFMLAFAEQDTFLKAVLKPMRSMCAAVPLLPLLLIFAGVFFRAPIMLVLLVSGLTAAFAIWEKVLEGHAALDERLLLMARSTSSFWNVFLYLRLPHLIPYISAGIVTAWSRAFGMGLLAEFLSEYNGSVGGSLKVAFASLLSETLFAWCILLCAFGIFSCWLISLLARRIRFEPRLGASDDFARNGRSFPLVFDRISKTVGEEKCLDAFSYVFSNGKVTSVCSKNPVKRNSLLMVAAAIEKDDEGRYAFPPTAPALIFEAPCLIPNLTVRENILFANRAANMGKILKSLSLIKEADMLPGDLDLPTRKRVAIARAIAFGGGVGIFCEPFAGMDEDTKALSAAALFGAYRGKTVLFATDNEEDAKRFGNEVLNI